MSTSNWNTGHPCHLDGPPEAGLLDRLALWLEGRGEGQNSRELVDLSRLLAASERARLSPAIEAFYREPGRYALRTGVDMGGWSRLCMATFAAVFRQSVIADREPGSEQYEVCQRLYRDRRGRLHWDRYARVDGKWRRLFVARMDAQDGLLRETFVLYGLPVHLAFAAQVRGEALVLTLNPRRSSLAARMARVQYTTRAISADGTLETHGDFRVPTVGLRVQTMFRMEP